MMMLSEKTAYKAVAFAARHKWAKPFCFGVYSAVYAAEKLKADEKPFSRRLIAFATASAFVFMTVPTSYAAALTQPETEYPLAQKRRYRKIYKLRQNGERYKNSL